MNFELIDSLALLLASASFVATASGFLIAASSISGAAKSEFKRQKAAYDAQRLAEAEEMLRIIAYADDAYYWDEKGERGISTPLQGLAAALLRDHPEQLPTIILLREHIRVMAGGNMSWTSVQAWLDQTIAYHRGEKEPPAPTF